MWQWVWIVYLFLVFLMINGKIVISFINFIRRVNLSRKIPGPPLTEVFKNSKIDRILPWLQQISQRYGSIFHVWLGKNLFILISDPQDVKLILGNNQILHKSVNYDILNPWLGKGLLTNGGESWHIRRKLLTPAFHFKILNNMKAPMEDNCDILIDILNKVADEQVIDIYPYFSLFALDVICETAMGIKKNAQRNSDSDYVKSVRKMCQISQLQIFSIWSKFLMNFSFSKVRRERTKALSVVHGETKRLIKLRRKILEDEISNGEPKTDESNDIGQKRKLAFLDMLLIAQREGANLTDCDIREEVDTFMFEGHDTTSSALSSIFYFLSVNPEVQQKAYEEAIRFNENDLESMKYLEAVIKESLRLNPPVPLYSRVLREDFKIRDFVLPVGTSISIFAYMIHRNPEVYPDPERFYPERFLNIAPDNNPYNFVAFSAGPRNCIGQKFAMLEMKCTVSKLLKNFEFLPVENFKFRISAELVMKSVDGFLVKIKKRK